MAPVYAVIAFLIVFNALGGIIPGWIHHTVTISCYIVLVPTGATILWMLVPFGPMAWFLCLIPSFLFWRWVMTSND